MYGNGARKSAFLSGITSDFEIHPLIAGFLMCIYSTMIKASSRFFFHLQSF